MHEPLPTSSIIQITPQLIEQLTLQSNTFEAESKRSDQQYYKSNENAYFVISLKFLQEWKEITRSAIENSAGTDTKLQTKTPGPMNMQLVETHLTDFNEYELKKQIQEGVDFKFYNTSVMNVFGNYQGAQIVRKAYWSGVDKKIEMYPIKFEFVYMSKSWAERIDKEKDVQIPVYRSLGYKNQTILDLLYRLVEYSKRDPRNKDQIYKNNAASKLYLALDFDPKQYANKLRQQARPYQKLQSPGVQIKNDKMIGELQIPKQKFTLIVQLQQDKWLYKVDAPEMQRCEFCRDLKKLPFQCKCKQVRYCSVICKDKDWRYHARSCDAQHEEDNAEPQFNIKQDSKNGLVGLSNLGNTCYMNAALQCMLHTRDLTQYIRDKKYVSQINQKNPIGSGGKLIKSYAKFIQACLTTEDNVVMPTRLKYTVGKIKDMFAGFQQHDSQEFLLFMLDTLHEDLNRVINKPFTSGVENEGRPDSVVAKESWITYLKRNQSIVNDLMGGQYRSEVKCPDCHRISVTFDPYLIFAVPIPSTEAKQINLYYFMANYNAQTLKLTLTSHNNLVKQLIDDVAAKSKTEVKQILFFISGFNGSVRRVDQKQTVDKLINEKQLNQNSEQRQLFAMQFQQGQLQNLQQKKWLVFKFITKQGLTLTFKRIFPMRWKHLKGSELFDRICEFLLNLWTKSQKKAQGKQRQTKIKVYRSKVQQQKIFNIFMAYGKATQIKNKLTYQKRCQIEQGTDVGALLAQNNFEVEFEVQFAQNPYYTFNSYKTHTGDGAAHSSYDYGESVKSGSDETYTLYECLDEMKKSQKLVEGNQVFCTHCQELKLAEKKMELYKSSKYLVMQLRRFKQVGYEKTKNYALVKFPGELDLANHILSPTTPQNYFINDDQFFIKPKYWEGYDKSASTKYRLYGVVNHHGSLTGGHYTAFATHNKKWYKFDDSDVSQIQIGSIVTSAAYLLFYERIQ